MSQARHARLKAVFAELVELAPGAERDRRLGELCAGDAQLAARVEELLRFDATKEDDQLARGAALRSDLDAIWERQGAALEEERANLPARYEIVRPLGEGGFGTVFLAREKDPIPRLVAIKVIKAGMDTREVLARFDSERRVLATMDHPGIARVFAAGADGRGRPYFVMEYVEGRPITRFCDERRASVRARLELLIEVCQAIQHAHYRGIVHRDIKPANVLVTLVDERPSPKIIDFGIAKAAGQDAEGTGALTHAGQLVGTPVAMSPEQARGGAAVDTRADVYALGGIAYELLCGVTPFAMDGDTSSLAELRQRILEEEPLRPSARLRKESGTLDDVARRRDVDARTLERELSAELDWIVMKALAKEPQRRYSSPNDLARDIERYLANEPVTARPPSRSYQVAKFARRHRASLAAASIMLVLLVAGSVGTGLGWRRSVRALAQAREQETLAKESLELARLAEAEARKQTGIALDEAAFARSINSFLNDDLLSAVSPESMGFDVPMRLVLDVAASKIGGRFEGRPRIERALRTTLGRTYRSLALHGRAEEQLQAALACDVGAGQEGDAVAAPSTDVRERALVVHELGRLRLQQNRNEEAEGLLREAWEDCADALGELDPQTIDALHFLGVSLAEQGRFDEAGEAFDASRAEAVAAFGEQSELAIQALHSQGLLRSDRARSQGREPDARTVELLEEALRASRALHDSDDPRTVRRIIDLAAELSDRDPPRARELFEEAHERSRRVQGPRHPTTAVAALGLGDLYLRAGDLERATERMEEALEIVTPLGESQPLLARARFELAICRLQAGRLEEAETLALAAYEALAENGRPAREVAGFLAAVFARDGKPDDAAIWRQVASEGPDGGHGGEGSAETRRSDAERAE